MDGLLTRYTHWSNSLIEHLLEILANSDHCLSPLNAVVFARVSENGQLLQANQGCRRILGIADDSQPLPKDVRNLFIQPSFSQLIAIHPEPGRQIYQGIINVGNVNTKCRSLIGVVYRTGQELLLLGEYDVAKMEILNAQVLELNEQLAETQRNLARTNRRLQENESRLKAMSLTDPLTGLANRRHLMEFLQAGLDRSRRYSEPFSVIMSDIDHFKQVNDGFGHDVGDEVLLAFANMMKNSMRTVDLVARLGGEEFIIALPRVALDGAMATAERLRAKTQQLHFTRMGKPITASFGVAQLQSADNAESLLKHADEAVYASKHGGRDRVTAHS